MSRIVLDANIAVEWVMTEPATAVGNAAWEAYAARGAIAPRLFWAESRNVVLKIARRLSLTDDVRAAAMAGLDELDVTLEDEVRERTVLGFAIHHHLSVYDALYLEIATRTGRSLATNDRALRRAAEAEGVALV